MPNWKKIIVSGSDASLSSAYIDGNLTASAAYLTSASIGHLETIYETASVIYSSGSTKFGDTLDDTHEITGSLLVSSSITSISASIDNLTANDKLQLGGAGSQFFAFNEDTIKVKFANWYSSNDRQYGMGQLWYETWFAAIDNQAGRDNRRIGFYLEEPDAGSTDSGTPGQHPSNARFYVDINGAYLSGSLNVEQSITGSEISASLIGTASIADFATTASHVIGGATNSGSFSGSFEGDGSGLTGITVGGLTTLENSFTSQTSVTSSHSFNTKNINVVVFDDNDEILIPQTIRALDSSNVGVDFAGSTTGRIVLTKGGHIVTGSEFVSDATLIEDTFSSTTSVTSSHNFGTKNVNVVVYDNNDNLIIPSNVRTLDINKIGIDLAIATTGRAVITKGGHLVSGSININEITTVTSSFTSQTSVTSSHNFGSKNVNVVVYDNNDNLILPSNVRTLDDNNVGIDLAISTTGRSVITKGGHIVSGSVASASLAETASFVETAQTASYGNNFTASNLYVEGTASITYLESVYETASVIYSSGSTKFGDDTSDTHEITGSLEVSGSANLVASQSVNNNTSSGSLSFWNGSQTEYDALGSYDNNTIYFVT